MLNVVFLKEYLTINIKQTNRQTIEGGETSEVGKKLYFGGDVERGITACIACHGSDAKGMAQAGFPAVGGQSAAYLKSQLEYFRDGTRNNDKNAMMRNIAMKLEDADIAALVKYMSTIK